MSKRARRPAKRRSTPRRRRRSGLSATLLVLAGIAAALLVPSVRAGAAHAGAVVSAIMAEARETEARYARTAAYASRYSITPELARDIYDAAVAEGVDPELGFRLVHVESSFDEFAVSPAGALGLSQLMPATAAWLQPGITRDEIFDRETNLRLGFRYFRRLLLTYDGRVDEALHAYNRGPGTVDRIRAEGGDPANGYADRVLGPTPAGVYEGSGLLPTP